MSSRVAARGEGDGAFDATTGKHHRTLVVAAGSDTGANIPYTLIVGAKPGPRLALISGLHGAEYATAVALHKLASEIDPTTLEGSVAIVPLVNIEGFRKLMPRINPVDGKNMNRVFPGSPTGTQSERIADAITNAFIRPADYIVDYHCGDIGEKLTPYAYWVTTGEASKDATRLDMLSAFDIRYILKFDATGVPVEKANLLGALGNVLGKPTITVEAGGAGTYTDSDIRILNDGARAMMAKLGMLPAAAPAARHAQVFVDRTQYLRSPVDGYFFPAVKAGDMIAKNQRLAWVEAFDGRRHEVRSPESGVVLFNAANPAAVKDDTLFYIGVLGAAVRP